MNKGCDTCKRINNLRCIDVCLGWKPKKKKNPRPVKGLTRKAFNFMLAVPTSIKSKLLNVDNTIPFLQYQAHAIAIAKGFWDKGRNDGELIALIHSELSEALEEIRKKKCDLKKVGTEMADCVIRILDFCEARKIDLETAILNKMEKNKKRPYKHGKRF